MIKKLSDNDMSDIVYLSTNLLRKSRWNPRLVFDPEKLNILKRSIEQSGIQYPLLVRKAEDECYEVLDGLRRLEAAKILNIPKVPCKIIDGNDEDVPKISLKIHLSQDDLTPEEIVNIILNMIEEGIYEGEREACGDLGIAWSTYMEWKKQAKVTRRETGIPASTIVIVEASKLDQKKKNELIDALRERPLPKEYVKKIVKMLEENPKLITMELVGRYAEAEPKRSDDVVEAKGEHLYRLRLSSQDVIFEVVEKALIIASVRIPRADLPILKRLFLRAV